ncbi:MAG TPA: glucosaminidase domain-containing protein [Clostridia bacterium]|nr:glucosaminidase domain-containing protein [Clostridia bacterium]
MTRDEFIRVATEAARTASARSGLPAGVTVAQAALESRWGESQLSRRANNFFGIKAHGKHAWVEMPTTEFFGGSASKVKAKFARYESMAQCFACRDALIANGALYLEARTAAKDPEKFIRALAKRWATDPKYAEKLMKVYAESGLVELDR